MGSVPTTHRPVLASSCQRATSAAEARHRIAAPIDDRRTTVVVALDDQAANFVVRAANGASPRVRLLTAVSERTESESSTDADRNADRSGDHPRPFPAPPSSPWAPPSSEGVDQALAGADLAVLVAATPTAASSASRLGARCAHHGVTTAAVVVDPTGNDLQSVVAALRPHATMLLWTRDAEDIADLLVALRA